MDEKTLYALAADLLLATHLLFVAFVTLGLVLILAGRLLAWSWVRNPWFRLLHLVAIGIVVIQSWLDIVCPLTTWEMAFRARAGDLVYPGAFIAHWLEAILYYRAPGWVFAASYTAFGALVVAAWFWVRPRPFGRSAPHGPQRRH
jgi:hypothetical protein